MKCEGKKKKEIDFDLKILSGFSVLLLAIRLANCIELVEFSFRIKVFFPQETTDSMLNVALTMPLYLFDRLYVKFSRVISFDIFFSDVLIRSR